MSPLWWGAALLGALAVAARRKRPTGAQPVDHQCDPVDATTWPPGKLCVHDGTQFVYVDAGPTPTPEPIPTPGPGPASSTNCTVTVLDDHVGGQREPHGVSASEVQKVNTAVALGKDDVDFWLGPGRGATAMFPGDEHEHRGYLNTAQLAALRSGAIVETGTTSDDGHTHTVRVSCQRVY